jgi:hypothetical protein
MDLCLTGWTLGGEAMAFDALRQIMASHALDSSDLAAFAARIERLAGQRPDLGESVAFAVVLCRRSVLSEESDDSGFLKWERSAWRYGFRRSFARAAALGALRRVERQFAGLRDWPPIGRSRTAHRIAEDPRFHLVAGYTAGILRDCSQEECNRSQLELLRAAIAMARYREETGEEAADPALLVPRYLPAVPVCPESGETLLCREGWVGFHEDARRGWTVRRRSDAAPAAVR